MESREAAIARKLGISIEQVREVLESEQREGGFWSKSVQQIITHADRTRHWSSQTCPQCEAK